MESNSNEADEHNERLLRKSQTGGDQRPAESNGFNLRPGHVLFSLSVPLCVGTYLGYQSSQAYDKVIGKSWSQPVQDLSAMDEGLRRILASSMALRALRIATMGTMGCFALFGAAAFYASGCQNMDELMIRTKAWSSRKRRKLDAWLGVQKRVQDTSESPPSRINGSLVPDEIVSSQSAQRNTLQQAIEDVRAWSSARRQKMDSLFGVEKRVQDRPEFRNAANEAAATGLPRHNDADNEQSRRA
jgi:hypothetical protein